MAGEISRDDDSYTHFFDGYNTRVPPLTSQDKHMLDFAIKTAQQPVLVTHGQILRNFGMYPPEFWTRAQALAQHPDVSDQQRVGLDKVMPEPSRPGPMTGGYDVGLGLEQYP